MKFKILDSPVSTDFAAFPLAAKTRTAVSSSLVETANYTHPPSAVGRAQTPWNKHRIK